MPTRASRPPRLAAVPQIRGLFNRGSKSRLASNLSAADRTDESEEANHRTLTPWPTDAMSRLTDVSWMLPLVLVLAHNMDLIVANAPMVRGDTRR